MPGPSRAARRGRAPEKARGVWVALAGPRGGDGALRQVTMDTWPLGGTRGRRGLSA
ncbi:protein of unknown function [Streptomyces murinus]